MSKISVLVDCVCATNPTICQEVNFGNIPNFQAQKINQIIGIKVNGAKKVLTAYGVRHILKEHGNNAAEIERGQRGITNADFELIPEILLIPDKIEKGKIVERNKQSMYFIKKLKYEYFVAVILEGKNEGLRLVVKTMYKKPI